MGEGVMVGELRIGDRAWALSADEDFSGLPKGVREVVEAWFDARRDVMVLRTSGSTGAPKRIEISKEAMRESARRTAEALDLWAGTLAWWVLPPAFIGGCMMLVRAAELGWTLLYDEPTAKLVVPAGGVDFCACTPMQLLASGGLSGVKTLLLGGSPVRGELPLAGVTSVYMSFGMTETVSHIALKRIQPDPEAHFTCVRGVKVSANAQGCLVVEAPHLLMKPLVTRDVVEILSYQTFRWLGRADHAINSGGVKVHPESVELALMGTVGVGFVVTSRPHPTLGEEVVLVADLADPMAGPSKGKEETWLRAARAMLPKHHAPRAVVWHNLDKTETGKWIRPTL